MNQFNVLTHVYNEIRYKTTQLHMSTRKLLIIAGWPVIRIYTDIRNPYRPDTDFIRILIRIFAYTDFSENYPVFVNIRNFCDTDFFCIYGVLPKLYGFLKYTDFFPNADFFCIYGFLPKLYGFLKYTDFFSRYGFLFAYTEFIPRYGFFFAYTDFYQNYTDF